MAVKTTTTTTTNATHNKSHLNLHHHQDSSIGPLKLVMPTELSKTERRKQKNLLKASSASPNATLFHSVGMLLVTLLIVSAIHESICEGSMKDQFHPIGLGDFNLEGGGGANDLQETIEPMVLIDKSTHELQNIIKHHRTNHKLDRTTTIGEGPSIVQSIALASAIKATGCPDKLKIRFSGFGDKFVIDLVKNKRLISDRYFQISKDNAKRQVRQSRPDVSSKKFHDNYSKHSNKNNKFGDEDDHDFYKNHSFLNLHNFTTNDDHCHYHGYVNNELSSISAISIVDFKLLSGLFHDGNEIYYLHANSTSHSTILTKSSNVCISSATNKGAGRGGLPLNESLRLTGGSSSSSSLNNDIDAEIGHKTNRLIRSRRAILASNNKNRRSSSTNSENYIRHEPYLSNSSSLYVELLVVHDHSQYIEYKANTSNIAERTMQIVNIMNAFYRQLNIFIGLVGVVLWVEKDEIQLTEDGDSTLTNFLKYRYEKLLPKFHHDNAQLITSTSFNGSVVGKALKGPICTHEHSGGVNTDHSHNPAIVAVTLAHELGHNFGMEHDEDENCKCPDEKCIMSSSSSTVHPKHWSSCSIDYLEDARKHGLLDCLANKPKKGFGPTCGNGFVEDGEDCDLGEPIPVYGTSKNRKAAAMRCNSRGQDCDPSGPALNNPCCDRQTCKFVANATCAQGPCCDLSRCSVFNRTETRVCRPRKTECDFEELCDGKSEYCPQDVHYHDGIECGPTVSSSGRQPIVGSAGYNRSRAYCYNGRCASHESQCQLLWGPSGSVSKDICYEQNVHGNTSGNCGYNWRDKSYDSCEQEDAICGMLHCVHNQPNIGDSRKTGKLGYGFESASVLTVSFFVMSNHAKIYCHGAIIDAGPNSRDPGLVPNGAACGEDRMCVNQKCTPVLEVVYKNWCPSDCNGNGVCDNTGTCHCFDGTIGTSCYQFFGPNFHLSLLLYIVMFFVPLVGLIVIAANHYSKKIKLWWFLHNRKIILRQKRENQPKRAAAYDVDGHKISISEPIPLAASNNINRPFYEPSTMLDPWDETSCDQTGGKGLGYRLVPLKKQPVEQPVVNLSLPPPPLSAPHTQPQVQVQAQAATTSPANSSTLKPGK